MTPLTDDPLDAELHAALHRIEGRSPLAVDVDTVIARGRSRRRAVLAERILTVCVVLAVVVGATVFAVRSSSSPDVVVGPSPSPTANPLALIVDLNGEYTESRSPRTGSTMLLLSNQTGQRVTITGWSLVDAPASARAGLAAPIANGDYESLSAAQRRALIAAPKRTTVELDNRHEVNLLVQLAPSCTAADAKIRPSVVLELRADDGTTTKQVIAPDEFAGVMPGGDSRDWVDWAIAKACGDKLPYAPRKPAPPSQAASAMPSASVAPPAEPVLDLGSAGSSRDPYRTGAGWTELSLRNSTGRRVTVAGWQLTDRTGSTRAALIPQDGQQLGIPSPEFVGYLAAHKIESVVVGAGADISFILQITPSCTAADKQIQPVLTLDLRYDDGTAGQTVIQPTDGYDVGYSMPYDGWVAATIAQGCARS